MALLTVTLAFTLLGGLSATPSDSFDHTHARWDAVVHEAVSPDGAISLVDYAALKRKPGEFDAYLAELTAVTAAEFGGWSESQRLAFLINAYNAWTVKLIVDNYPVESIKELGGWLSSPWKQDFFELLGETRNLDDIEHGMIRQNFKEPRIHFAVNCASLGCPPLRAEAFRADRLDEQLEDNTRIFLQDVRRNKFDAARNTLHLSSIFKWYGSDFVATDGSVEAFVASRITADPAKRREIASRQVRIRFLDYDWTLNGRK